MTWKIEKTRLETEILEEVRYFGHTKIWSMSRVGILRCRTTIFGSDEFEKLKGPGVG